MDELINTQEVAYRLGVPVHRVEQMEEDGEIECTRIGGEKLYDPFMISRLPGHAQPVPSLQQSQYLLGLCEASTC